MSGILNSPRFKIIVANCIGRGIGYKGDLPWNLRGDMRRFKQLTIGNGNNAIVMGRNTWESISKRPLPSRDNLVLSTILRGEYFFPSIKKIKKHCLEKEYDDVWIIGGEKVYEQFIHDADTTHIYLTKIDEKFPCDTYFPVIPSQFKLSNITSAYEEGGIQYNYQLWGREK